MVSLLHDGLWGCNIMGLHDPNHRIWNDCMLGIRGAGLHSWELVTLAVIGLDPRPWSTARRWAELKASAQEYRSISSSDCPIFSELWASIASELGVDVAAPLDHARKQAGVALEGQRGGARTSPGPGRLQTVWPMHTGPVRGKGKEGQDVKGTSKGDLMQAEKEKVDAKKLAEKNKDKQCFNCQTKGHVKSDCVICKGLEFCGRKRIVLRTGSEGGVPSKNGGDHPGGCAKYSSASMDAIEVANHLVGGRSGR